MMLLMYWEFYVDSDGDGYGDSDDTVLECSVPEGYAVDGDDCDDNDPTSLPCLMKFAMRLIIIVMV